METKPVKVIAILRVVAFLAIASFCYLLFRYTLPAEPGVVPKAGNLLFGVEPFFEPLTQLTVFQEQQGILLQLTRFDQQGEFKIQFWRTQHPQVACVRTSEQLGNLRKTINPRIKKYLGRWLGDVPPMVGPDEALKIGFGSSEGGAAVGFITYKSFGQEVEIVDLGYPVPGEVDSFYAMSGGGHVSIIDLGPIFQGIQTACAN